MGKTDKKKRFKASSSEAAAAIFGHATSHPPSDLTLLISTLKGNKRAIRAFKSFLDTLANDDEDSGDESDENHQPDEDRLLSPADVVKIEMNDAELIPRNSSKPSLKGKASVRSSAKVLRNDGKFHSPLLYFDHFPGPPCVFTPLSFRALVCVLHASWL
jgi:hypothetical protein